MHEGAHCSLFDFCAKAVRHRYGASYTEHDHMNIYEVRLVHQVAGSFEHKAAEHAYMMDMAHYDADILRIMTHLLLRTAARGGVGTLTVVHGRCCIAGGLGFCMVQGWLRWPFRAMSTSWCPLVSACIGFYL